MSGSAGLPTALLERAARPYRASGRYAWHFARGKLARDPLFAGLLERGLIGAGARVLDLGCGQGLLAALLLAADAPDNALDWPEHWAPPPRGATLRGIELAPRDVQRARSALGGQRSDGRPRVRFEQGDIATVAFDRSDVVVLFDVLHYLECERQQRVLARARDCLQPGGTLLLRVSDAMPGWRTGFSHLLDGAVFAARGRGRVRLHGRPVSAWQQALAELGFATDALPMHAGTPFRNVLIVGQLGAARPAPAATSSMTHQEFR